MAAPLDSIGLSFAPNGQGQTQQQDASPLQQAIKILSLRVPQNAGPSGITPNALLTGPGSAGLGSMGGGGGMDLMSLLRRLLQPGQPGPGGMAPGGMAPGGMAPGAPPPSVPLPNITVDENRRRAGEGTTTFPGLPAGAPTYDRSNPGAGNRGGGPSATSPWSPAQPPADGMAKRGPFFRQG